VLAGARLDGCRTTSGATGRSVTSPVGCWDIEEFTKVAEVTTEQLAAYVDDSQRGLVSVLRRRSPKELEARLDLRRTAKAA
jgi:hypothetical protein